MWPPLLLAVGCWKQCPGCGRRCLLSPMELGHPNNHRGVFLQKQLHFIHARRRWHPIAQCCNGMLPSMSLAQSATCCCPFRKFRRRSTDTQQGLQTSAWQYSAANSSRHITTWPWASLSSWFKKFGLMAVLHSHRLTEASSCRSFTSSMHVDGDTPLHNAAAGCCLRCPWHSLQPAAARLGSLGGGVRTRSRVRRRLRGSTPLQTHHDISQPGRGPRFLLGSKSLDMAVS